MLHREWETFSEMEVGAETVTVEAVSARTIVCASLSVPDAPELAVFCIQNACGSLAMLFGDFPKLI